MALSTLRRETLKSLVPCWLVGPVLVLALAPSPPRGGDGWNFPDSCRACFAGDFLCCSFPQGGHGSPLTSVGNKCQGQGRQDYVYGRGSGRHIHLYAIFRAYKWTRFARGPAM